MAARYHALLAGLPPLPPSFEQPRPPISRPRLEKRLDLLPPRERRIIALLEDVTRWAHLPLEHSDADYLDRYRQAMAELTSPVLREAVDRRLDLRTVVANLRARRLGLEPPSRERPRGAGRYLEAIRRRWTAPHFGLELALPWLPEVRSLLQSDHPLALERLLLGLVWRGYRRLAEGHYFNLEALALYVLRWDVVDRWVAYDAEAGRRRFGELVEQGMVGHERIFD